MKVLVAFDGTLASKDALIYGIRKVREYRGELIALHVFPSYLFVDYDEGTRASEIARKEALRRVEEASDIIREIGTDIRASVDFTEGIEQDEILRYAKIEDVDLIVAPPSLDMLVEKACCLTDIVTAGDAAINELPD